MDLPAQRELARLLARLRRDGQQQSGLDPRLVPADKAIAYRVAGMVAEELGWPVGGWKIAAMKEEALDGPMVPLTWLANELSRTGIGLKAGQMISTGTLTGMLAPKPGETYVADFGSFGSVTLSLV